MAYPRTELDELMPVVYDELRRLAQKYLSRERSDHTLQTTALVHEAYLRLVDQKAVNWQNRAQFFGIAARMMRRILINHANDRQAKKRQGYATRISLDDAVNFSKKPNSTSRRWMRHLTSLQSLIRNKLKSSNCVSSVASQSKRFRSIEISPATTKREWDSAKLWLRRQFGRRYTHYSATLATSKASAFARAWNSTPVLVDRSSIPRARTMLSSAPDQSIVGHKSTPATTRSSNAPQTLPLDYVSTKAQLKTGRGSVHTRSCARSVTAAWAPSISRSATTSTIASKSRSS